LINTKKKSNKKSMTRSITWKTKGKTKERLKTGSLQEPNKEKELIPLEVGSNTHLTLAFYF
jgi:hypothetical protein